MNNNDVLFFDINNTHIPKVYSIDEPIKIILTVLSRSEHKIVLDSISGVLNSLDPIQIDKGQAVEDEIVVRKEIKPFRFFTIEITAKPKGAPKKIKLSPIFHYTYQSKKFHYTVGEFQIVRDDIYLKDLSTQGEIIHMDSSNESRTVKAKTNVKKLGDKPIIKIVLMGDGAVGKTALKESYVTGRYTGNYTMTLGVDFAIKNVRLKVPEAGFDARVVYQLWDLGGQQRFNTVRKTFYQGANGGIFVWDITRPRTLISIDSWLDELLDFYKKIPLVIVANKVDVCSARDTCFITEDEIETLIEKVREIYDYDKLPFFMVSAKTGYNVDLAFETLGRIIVKKLVEENAF